MLLLPFYGLRIYHLVALVEYVHVVLILYEWRSTTVATAAARLLFLWHNLAALFFIDDH